MPRPNRGYQLGFYTPRGYQEKQWTIYWYEKGTQREHATGLTDSAAIEEAEAARAALQVARSRPVGPLSPERMTIRQALDYYGAEHGPQTSDPARIGHAIDALISFWGDSPISAVRGETCRAYMRQRKRQPGNNKPNSKPIAPATIRKELGTLNAAFKHCHREGYLTSYPGVWLPEKTPGRERWLTRNELAALIRAARREPKARKHLPTFFLLATYSVHRLEAVLTLQWRPNTTGGWIDLERGIIDFNAVGRPRTKKRRSIIPIPHRLLMHLRYVRKRTHTHAIEVGGKPVTAIKRSFRTACRNADVGGKAKRAGEPAQGLKDVVRHTLRHTGCTWMMQKGVPIWQAAEWAGMSEEMFRKTYAHHHPDYLKEAKEAWR
ncbi:MAG: site-specific integrase [Rhodospirillaceae bacterium]|nr:site-specific integrase [Rhodospirillaceae bacterium]